MDRALALARQGRGRTSPNPMVGAVVVSDAGEVVRQRIPRAGRRGALRRSARSTRQARWRAARRLYCTLEPCAHQGRTGPCVVRIAEAGVQRVVVAVGDPSPKVNGAGIAWLRQRGIQVDVGVRRAEAARLNEAFLTWAASGRPFVTMKIATSLDGRIASQPGVRTPITGAAAVAAVHGTRAEVDAVGVGSTTHADRRSTPDGARGAAPAAADADRLRPAVAHAAHREEYSRRWRPVRSSS
ncbi:Riboflavin biosynthesis protein RibD [Geodia barretti]|uniref:5-amino-6-(5-phosphoribosylamino)uracil reductase n=1 Tax=Geodia barretti TaxID=519541 RepID=A0AA35TJL6_GEOBA|nr:Riboflavin biosynthesis protein RibD [Geodia barretti]